MKTSLLLGLLEITILQIILFSLTCCGVPITTSNQGFNSRQSRSMHALHARLCPEGTSSKNCFYSQLSMFMQMHEPLRDLASSRSIGKRSMPALNYIPASSNTIDTNDNVAYIRKLLMTDDDKESDIFDPISPAKTPAYTIEDTDDVFNVNDIEGTDNELNIFGSNGQEFGKTNEYSDNRNINNFLLNKLFTETVDKPTDNRFGLTNIDLQYPSVNKRQIVCPPGKTKLNCYNDAFAYYMRMLQTVEDN
ncbi:hypothetical protein ACF0H5_015817 [Mactra antiquata]